MNRNAAPGRVRIIGGKWRRHWLKLPADMTVRPSSDRVRETLFNWLAPNLAGAYCLDLFAGTGALGLEAVSRGAARAVLVEHEPRVVRQLKSNVAPLITDQVEIIEKDACLFVSAPPARRFDLIFLDPPFDSDLLAAVLPPIAACWLAPSARLYIEQPRTGPGVALPDGWRIMHADKTRQTRYSLVSTGA